VVTVSTDPAATLHDLADYYRRLAEVTPLGGERSMLFALAEHVEGAAQRYKLAAAWRGKDLIDGCHCPYCADTSELLAVADAAGITSERQGTV
jgi:hypothetical protein